MPLRNGLAPQCRAALWVVLTTCPALAQAAAEIHHSPIVFGQDDRRIADTTLPPWHAIGRVNTTVVAYEFRFCTGFLVAPDTVLTMASCVSPLKDEPGRLHFVTGDLRGKYQEHAIVKCVQMLDVPAGGARLQLARLKLRKALQATPLEMMPATEIAVGDAVAHAGYGGDWPFVLSVDETCRVTSMKGGNLQTNCDTARGQGGGPILRFLNQHWRVAAIMADAREDSGSGGPVASTVQHAWSSDPDCD